MIDFAAVESFVNTTALGVMANARLTWGGSFSADGVFRKPSDVLLGDLIQGDQPTFTALTTYIGSLAYGAAVAISGVNYTVARNEPDGTGVSTLTLQKV